jgi:hypothetical protein
VGLTLSSLRRVLPGSKVQCPRKKDNFIAHMNLPASAQTRPIGK